MMLRQLLYRGPARSVLHETYAKQSRLDTQAPITTASTITIDAPVERVWALLIDLPAWPTITPAIRDVRLESRIEVDAYFRFRLYHVPIRAQFAVVQPQREVTWTGRSLWFTAIDQHRVEPLATGGTRLAIGESFAGLFAVPLMSRAQLQRQHEQWLQAFKRAAEQG